MHPYDAAVWQIEEADLPAPVYRTARRLLDCADGQFGHVRLTKDQALRLVATTAYGTVRSHLIQLQRKGIIHYSTNEEIYVNFAAWPRALSDHPRALSDHSKDDGKEERALSDHPRAPSARNLSDKLTMIAERSPTRAERSPTRAERSSKVLPIGYWLVGSIDPITTSTEETNQPVVPQPLTETEQQQSYDLLLDEDLLTLVHQRTNHDEKARAYATTYPFAWLLQQVGTFWVQFQAGKVRSIGALYNRIDNNWRPEAWAESFLASDLYRRHFPLSKAEAERRQREAAYRPDASQDPVLDLFPMPIWPE